MSGPSEPRPVPVTGDASSAARRRELAERLAQARGLDARRLPLAPRPAGTDAVPLTFAQEGMWFVEQTRPGSTTYNLVLPHALPAPVHRAEVERALAALVARHGALRTVLDGAGASPTMRMVDGWVPALEVVEAAPDVDPARALRAAVLHELGTPFDLAGGPLLRARLVLDRAGGAVLLLAVHHLVADGWSLALITEELDALCEAARDGTEAALPALPIEYADFAWWQRRWSTTRAFESRVERCVERLRGLEPLELPTDHPRPAVPSFRGGAEVLVIDGALRDRVRGLARAGGASEFVTLLAAFFVLLHRYTGQTDLVVGVPLSLRGRPELARVVGLLVNMGVLRLDLAGEPSFADVLGRVRAAVAQALDESDVPYERLVQVLSPDRDLSRNPLFQVAFNLESPPVSGRGDGLAVGGDAQARGDAPLNESTKFDLEVAGRERDGVLQLVFIYSAELFEAATVRRMIAHYRRLLERAAEVAERPVRGLVLLGAEERRAIVEDWNATAHRYPREASIPALLEAVVDARPDALAVRFGDDALDYAALDARANRLAAWLTAHGVGAGTPVGVLLERGVDMVVTWLAALKAGGAYVPLDPEHPTPRLELMLDDAGAPVVVTTEALAARVPGFAGRVLRLDRDAAQIAACASARLPSVAGGDALAYVVYTSGSTGRPKGVAVPHRGVVRLVRDTDYVSLDPDDVVVQLSNASFDAATFEIWGALLNGARVEGVDRDTALRPGALADFLRARGATTLFVTTALFNQVAREAPACFAPLRTVLFGGEAVDPRSVRRVLDAQPPRRLLHVYGPTESTTFATWHVVRSVAADARTIPIGMPIANTTAYVLDPQREPVPVGVPGELYLGGDGLALGYLGQDALTAERFVPDPFGAVGARLYRTGDRVRRRADGAIEFLGRLDHQIKLRGFRIELPEIETVLARQPEVGEVVVLLREDRPGDQRLVAYLTPAAEAAARPDPVALRAGLRAELPDYMVPAAFVVLDAMPVNPNGKLDRAALPAPTETRQVEDEYVAPGNPLEAEVAAIWREVLGVERVGVRDNFFDLGGHSLLALRVRARLAEVLEREIPAVALFRHPTVETLARWLRGGDAVEGAARPAGGLARVDAAPAATGAIAVVGLAGRFPGAADADAFWDNLLAGRETIHVFDDAERRAAGIEESVWRTPGHVPARGLLDGAELFDAAFFGYTPREAERMDPQHRVLLECAWAALEDAGCDPSRFDGAIGMWAGSSFNSYRDLVMRDLAARGEGAGLATLLGAERDFLATRVSYKLDLRGPSLNVQTACSTSLVAVHEACRALRDGDCDMALAGGVSVVAPRVWGYQYQEQGIASPDGHCRPFDADAGGTVPGEGVALVVLRRLDDALRDGDRVRAVIRGSAINNDGADKVGFTAPSVDGQADAIVRALANAGVEPVDVSYVEAHGTGTALGDPIEVSALTRAFGSRAAEVPRCVLGAVKSNIGHLDAAAGVAGLVKTVLALEHRELPPTVHFRRPNPEIDLARAPFRVSAEREPWSVPDGATRIAGVSSFGMGGTNAHVVVEQAPPVAPSEAASRAEQVLCISARSPGALERMAAALAAHLDSHPEQPLVDVAYTLQAGRRPLPLRRAVVAADHAAAARALRAPVSAPVAAPDRPAEVAFLFPGQGAQHPGMARAVYEAEPAFREVVDACLARFRDRHGIDVGEALLAAPHDADAADRLRRTLLAQPALFTVEYALARLWMSWGVVPRAMLGHSIGEYAAACVAGVLSLDDAIDVVAARAVAMDAVEPGAMLAVTLAESELAAMLDADSAVAAVNAPGICVASGPFASMDALEARLRAQGASPRRLHTSHAFHSPMMAPAAAAVARAMQGVSLSAPRIPYLSNVTGTWIRADEATDPDYYARQLRGTVRYAAGLDALGAGGVEVLLEVGPGATLTALAARHPAIADRAATVVSLPPARAAQREAEETPTDPMQRALAALWVAGVAPDWRAVHGGRRRARVGLPTYPFERRRFWLEPPRDAARGVVQASDPGDWIREPTWARVSRTAGSAVPADGPWLVITGLRARGHAVAERLRALGATVTTATSGAAFAGAVGDHVTFDPDLDGEHRRLVAALDACGRGPRHVVDLSAVDSEREHDCATEVVADGLGRQCALVAALLAEQPARVSDLYLVTAGAHEVVDADLARPQQAAAQALAVALGLEHPQMRCRAIDLGVADASATTAAEGAMEALLAELRAGADEPVVALRGRHRWVRRFEPRPLARPAGLPARLREDGVYVVLGGLGGIGLELAEWLDRTARARLVLVGRRDLADRGEDDGVAQARRARVARLRSAEVHACDVRDPEALARLLGEVEARHGAVHGLFHLAGGEKRPRPIRDFDRADALTMLEPKILGVAAVATAIGQLDLELDFCCVFSSLSVFLGAGGFAAYVAGHQFMDAFATRAARDGHTPWLVIDWDNWNVARQALPPGTESMLPEAALDVLGRFLDDAAGTAVAVSVTDLATRLGRARAVGVADTAADAPSTDAGEASGHDRPDLESPYVAPRNPVEATLAGIWTQVLGIARIGVDDNFFELGGDSVINLQICARANQAGLALLPDMIFEHQTVAELAARVAGTQRAEADQAPVEGPLAPTPIQCWFLDQVRVHPAHFNQARVLEVAAEVTPAAVGAALDALATHHDALRTRCRHGASGAMLDIAPAPGGWPLERHDLGALGASDREPEMHRIATAAHASIDLAEGPPLRALWFDLGAERRPRLVLIAHHLVVDAPSWRILLEDLETACRQVTAGEVIALPPKTTSVAVFGARAREHAAGATVQGQAAQWRALLEPPPAPLPRDAHGENRMASADAVRAALDADETARLLALGARAGAPQVQDYLLAALARAVAGWSGQPDVLLEMEGLGRDLSIEGVDLARTVGWFTALYPIRLRASAASGLDPTAVRAQTAGLARRGAEFSLLRWLSPAGAPGAALAGLARPEILFMYGGRVDDQRPTSGPFVPVAGPVGAAQSSEQPRTHVLEVAATVEAGVLALTVVHSHALHRTKTVQGLLEAMLGHLRGWLAPDRGPSPPPATSPDGDIAKILETARRRVR
ncbi:MAG: amino acid adenylation domain-containing protein [Ectothiorhodospiraceae bacterium]|nr:amino acid adenylation domain-containing protein [Ectothiorhodospiraceae bacterium]